ncbi:unnamed protein product [Protopolystoma xenopodis]|uniref:Uncharacterized protein n=1 Tax=Protopolystoma xenopodis TaxID=117903 RepID=A0A448WI46_9PLAT|nr:unnamed protein product [Protopolystoma xenopodis]
MWRPGVVEAEAVGDGGGRSELKNSHRRHQATVAGPNARELSTIPGKVNVQVSTTGPAFIQPRDPADMSTHSRLVGPVAQA